jgi:hypothetical protein
MADNVNVERLTAVIFNLMRDHITTGVIPKILQDLGEKQEFTYPGCEHLGAYARDLAERILEK